MSDKNVNNEAIWFGYLYHPYLLNILARRPSLAQVIVSFGLGIAIYFSLRFEPTLSELWLLVPLIMVGLFAAKQWLSVRFPVLLLSAVGFGLFYVGVYSHAIKAPVLTYSSGLLSLQATAMEVERLGTNHERVTLVDITYPESYQGVQPEKIRITVRVASPYYESNDRLGVLAILEPPARPVYPDGFDSARWNFYKGIGATGYVVEPVTILAKQNQADSLFTKIEHLRDRISRSIEGHLKGQTAAVATALLTGQRAKISTEVREDMRSSGLAHLLAISGLHMALFTGVLFFAVRALLALIPKLALLYPIKKIAALVAWFGGAYYLLISGMSVSTVRAFIMVSVVLLAVLIDRQAISMRLLAFAGGIILLLNPSALITASFQMSFMAVFGLIAFYEGWRRYVHRQYSQLTNGQDSNNLNYDNLSGNNRPNHPLPKLFRNKFFAYPLGVMASTFVAEVSLLPVSAYHFHRFATYGLVANLFVMPLMGFWIMPFGLAALLLYPIGLEGLALYPMGWGIDAMLYVANIVASEEGSLVHLSNMPTGSFIAIIIAALFLFSLKGRFRALTVTALLVFSTFQWQANIRPHIIVESQGKMLALSDGSEGYYFTSLQAGRYARNQWRERFGLIETPHMRELRASGSAAAINDPEVACDDAGCVYQLKDMIVGLPKTYSALAQDCMRVGVLITNLRVQGVCPEPQLIIDSRALRLGGAHALWLDDNGDIEVVNVEGARGQRLWSYAN